MVSVQTQKTMERKVELIPNSSELSAKIFDTLEEALKEAASLKEDPNIVDIEIYDYSLPLDENLLYWASKHGGAWEEGAE